MTREWDEEHTVRADCGHWVRDHDELVEVDGRWLCPDCAEYGEGDE